MINAGLIELYETLGDDNQVFDDSKWYAKDGILSALEIFFGNIKEILEGGADAFDEILEQL